MASSPLEGEATASIGVINHSHTPVGDTSAGSAPGGSEEGAARRGGSAAPRAEAHAAAEPKLYTGSGGTRHAVRALRGGAGAGGAMESPDDGHGIGARTLPPALSGAPLPAALAHLPRALAPFNLAEVAPGLYRSGYPTPENLAFIAGMGLRSVVSLYDPGAFASTYVDFLRAHGIAYRHVAVSGNKDTPYDMEWSVVADTIVDMMDAEQLPMLVHCRSGKHRTGCLVAVLRRLMGWSAQRAADEYALFSSPKERAVDHTFIRIFDMRPVLRPLRERAPETLPKFLPLPLPSDDAGEDEAREWAEAHSISLPDAAATGPG